MTYRYDIHRGLTKIKTKTFVAISVIGLMVGGGGLSLAIFGTTHALSPSWNVSGSWKLDYSVNPNSSSYDPNLYDLSLTQVGQNVSGTGQYPDPGPYAYAWSAVGNVTGNNISLTDTYYLGAPGTVMHMNGTIASDGTMSGTWDDNYAGGRTGLWKSVSGNATMSSFDWGSMVNPSQCANRVGGPVINVTEKVTNDADSGYNGYWAFDTYNRQIQVWKTTAPETYCAVVRYEGQFQTVNGQPSPGTSANILSGNVKGTFEGGRTATITGTLSLNPSWATKGSVGTVNYNCNISGNCPDVVSWPSKYFAPTYSYSDNWWGWIYHAGDNGTWIDAMNIPEAVSGDITG